MAQYDRIYRLTIGNQGADGVVLEGKETSGGLNISFDITKDLTQQTNKASIKIYNLSEATALKAEKDDAVVVLEAGYSEDAGLKCLFTGYITHVTTSSYGGGRVTELTASDGQIPIRDCVVSLSYAEAVSRKKVIADIASAMGVAVTYADNCEFTALANGFSFIGPGRECLKKACAGSDLSWSIQNNILQIIKEGGTTKTEALKLTAASGLIGCVEKFTTAHFLADKNGSGSGAKAVKKKARKAGYKLKCLMQPAITPGDLVYVASKTATGYFKVDRLTHTGDYAGASWYTDLEVHELTAS